MEYRKVREDYIIRFDKGEEILERLAKFANMEGIGCASVSAIGATDDFTSGVFNATTREYAFESHQGDYEIASLNGNITRKDGKPYLHLHGVFSNADGIVAAGHLTKIRISVTCEMFVRVLDGEAERVVSEETGTNIIKVSK